jgi:hypothetical protein
MSELNYFADGETYNSEDFVALRVDQVTISTLGITSGMCPITIGPWAITSGMCPITVNALGLSTSAFGVYKSLMEIDQAIAELNTTNLVRAFAVSQRTKVREQNY